MISKRLLLAGAAASSATMMMLKKAPAQPAILQIGDLRGAIDASNHGIMPHGGAASQRNLETLLLSAARQNLPVYLPPGDYPVSALTLPDGARLTGIAGSSRLVNSGSGPMLTGTGARQIELSGIVIDGLGHPLPADATGLVQFRSVNRLSLTDCDIVKSGGTALSLARCSGQVRGNRVTAAAEYAIYAEDSVALAVSDNIILDCGNGGILVHRQEKGRDGTIVTGNRIARTGATNGGTGQYGNAINLYRAHDVVVSGNHITDAAFSAIRANSASNALISGNHCTGSGETAIYAEFAFEGAMIVGNIVDGAANGISVVNFNEGGRLASVANNIVRNMRPIGPYVMDGAVFGIGISVEADTSVSGNVVENAPFCGLALGYGPYLRNVVVSGNIVREAGIGATVTVVEDAGAAIITGNIFQALKSGAIIGYRWNDAATGDLAAAGAERFRHLTIEGNRVG